MIDEVLSLIGRHRRNGVLVDTNILLLYFIGRFDRALIPRFKRTQQFVGEDYDTLAGLLGKFNRVLTTPHILAEVNSLAGQLGEPFRSDWFRQFAECIGLLNERYIPSREASGLPIFVRLGLTDSATARLAGSPLLVMTDDLALYLHLSGEGVDVINFNHIRPLEWR